MELGRTKKDFTAKVCTSQSAKSMNLSILVCRAMSLQLIGFLDGGDRQKSVCIFVKVKHYF